MSGYSRVTKAVLVGTNTAVSASCNTGSVVLGGGISGNNVNLSVSYPSADDTWTVVASKTNGQNTVSATVYAICATVPTDLHHLSRDRGTCPQLSRDRLAFLTTGWPPLRRWPPRSSLSGGVSQDGAMQPRWVRMTVIVVVVLLAVALALSVVPSFASVGVAG